MKSVQDGVNELSPTTKFLKSRIYYFICQIHTIVIVSSYVSLSRMSLDNSLQERINLHRVLIEVPAVEYELGLDHHLDACDDTELELPSLID